jgi:hypothetical protein
VVDMILADLPFDNKVQMGFSSDMEKTNMKELLKQMVL